jgi:hypothetical protein
MECASLMGFESEPPPKNVYRVNMWSDVVRGELSIFTVANKATGMLETAVDVSLHSTWRHLIDAC